MKSPFVKILLHKYLTVLVLFLCAAVINVTLRLKRTLVSASGFPSIRTLERDS